MNNRSGSVTKYLTPREGMSLNEISGSLPSRLFRRKGIFEVIFDNEDQSSTRTSLIKIFYSNGAIIRADYNPETGKDITLAAFAQTGKNADVILGQILGKRFKRGPTINRAQRTVYVQSDIEPFTFWRDVLDSLKDSQRVYCPNGFYSDLIYYYDGAAVRVAFEPLKGEPPISLAGVHVLSTRDAKSCRILEEVVRKDSAISLRKPTFVTNL